MTLTYAEIKGKALPAEGHRCGADLPIEEGIPTDITPLTNEQKDVIHSTAPILVEHGETITRHFYKNMILAHPGLRNVFSQSAQATGHQAKALAQAVHAYAAHIHDLTPILPVVNRIAHKHASVHITPDQYAIVGRHLIQAIVDVLGDVVTREIAAAWTNGYWNLAKIFIDTEKGIYDEGMRNQGWEGFKPFKIASKEAATSEISHFYLEPANPAISVPKFLPGQYTSVKIPISSLGCDQIRQYSISHVSDPKRLRISVRRHDSLDSHPGLVSHALHALKEGDTVEISSPHGDFHSSPTDDGTHPLILLAAGIGQTPLYPILESVLSSNPNREVTYAVVIKNNEANAFKASLRALDNGEYPRFTYRVFHTRPLEGEKRFIDYHYSDRISVALLQDDLYLDRAGACYYLCGPGAFIVDMVAQLQGRSIPNERIHYELFAAGSPA